MDDRTLLAATGAALHGRDWKRPLAEQLQIDDRSLRRWIADNHVPRGVWADIPVLLERHAQAVSGLITESRART